MSRLLIFDIDGTLLQSTTIQMLCLERALKNIFQGRLSHWGEKEAHFTTDSGILAEISQELVGRSPSQEEQVRFKAAFLAALELALDQGEGIPATPGAASVLAPGRNADQSVAIATGGFQCVSSMKMGRAGLSFQDIPAAFAEDGFTKEEVLRVALRRAELYHGRKYDEVVYIGDASYDVRAASNLGFRFVGVGSGYRRQRLMECGAKVTIPDLTTLDRALNGETPPDE
jgi:phosphoglycolate phosphatase-like HAD superfamily hydrolase